MYNLSKNGFKIDLYKKKKTISAALNRTAQHSQQTRSSMFLPTAFDLVAQLHAT